MRADHLDFVFAAYAVTAIVLIGLAARILIEGRRLASELAKLGGKDGRGRL
jgi:heme exporter protein CcmD